MSRISESATQQAVRASGIRSYVATLPKYVAGRHASLIEMAFHDPLATVAVLAAAITASEKEADAAAARVPGHSVPVASSAAPVTSAALQYAAATMALRPAAVQRPYIDPAVLQGSASEAARQNALDVFERTIALAGHGDLIAAARADGVSTPQDVALRMLKRERGGGVAGAANGQSARALVDAQARAKVADCPGLSYVEAVRSIEGRHRAAGAEGLPTAARGSGLDRSSVTRSDLDRRARAHMATAPSMSYVNAVRFVQASDMANAARSTSARATLDADARAYMAMHAGVTYIEAVRRLQAGGGKHG